MEKLNRVDKVGKVAIEESIRNLLLKREDISFAYLHGSFVKEDYFHDIDIAVYLEKVPDSILEYELQLEAELALSIGKYIFDVRVLNSAPLSFKYNVIKNGVILLAKDDDKRCDFQETTITNYCDFLPYRKAYMKENIGIEI
ncbi:nucleotidyltransferase domain-containing protein [Thermodesulfobium sp. 4217-1]|uniref:type VII toxin-antitoxin system MntA family adenylyltransferase antitoxin n=1 Tax=Thermodesulfobium sp. 4217-1 TaxID=3120013 RepID=UPI00322222CB